MKSNCGPIVPVVSARNFHCETISFHFFFKIELNNFLTLGFSLNRLTLIWIKYLFKQFRNAKSDWWNGPSRDQCFRKQNCDQVPPGGLDINRLDVTFNKILFRVPTLFDFVFCFGQTAVICIGDRCRYRSRTIARHAIGQLGGWRWNIFRISPTGTVAHLNKNFGKIYWILNWFKLYYFKFIWILLF